jgi:Ni/Fe-hydrogenase subunit HybB-like protein
MAHFEFLYVGLRGQTTLVPWTWASTILAAASLALLLTPRYRKDERILATASAMIFLSLWIDKGLDLIVGGFTPSPLSHVTRYIPTLPEVAITLAIWAVGCAMITVFYKITLSVREELADL